MAARETIGATPESFQNLYASYSRRIEGRAIWMDAAAIPKDGRGIADIVRSYSRAGINILMPEVFRNGYTIYPSSVAARLPAFASFDPLEALIHEAHKRGMEVHPWVWVFRAGHSGDAGGILTAHPGWAAVGRNGEQISPGGGRWLCPSMPETRDFLRRLYTELATRYDIDGLHLDYVRFENESPVPYCYNDSCRSRFEEEYGIDPLDIDPFSPKRLSWNLWRERLANSFVQQVALDLRRVRPGIRISAAVASEPVTARTSYMQNWPNWAANKWVDFLCPMTYTRSEDRFRELVEGQISKVGFRTLLLPGVGLHLQNDPTDALDQIDAARFLGASGETLFASSYLKPILVDALRAGPYSRRARLPFRVTGKELSRKIKGRTKVGAPLTLDERDAFNLLGYLSYRDADTGYVAPDPPAISIPDIILPLPEVRVPRISAVPVMDGVLNDPAWQMAAVVALQYTEMGAPAPVRTEVRLAYDDTTLYFAITAEEPEIGALKAKETKRDGPVFYDDSVELFLDPTGKRGVYFQLAANTLGARFDQKMLTPAWNAEWQVAVHRDTGSWTMEMSVPFASLGAPPPKAGDTWTANFARNRWVTGKAEYIVWSVPYGSYNRMYRFGSMGFD